MTPCEHGIWADFIQWPSAIVSAIIRKTGPTASAASSTKTEATSTGVEWADPPLLPSTFVISMVGNSAPAPSQTGTSVATETSAASTAAAAASEPSSRGSSLGFGLGAGLGVPLGLASVGLLTFLMWTVRRHKMERRKSRATETEVREQEQSRREENVGIMPPETRGAGDEISTVDTRGHHELDASEAQSSHLA